MVRIQPTVQFLDGYSVWHSIELRGSGTGTRSRVQASEHSQERLFSLFPALVEPKLVPEKPGRDRASGQLLLKS